MTTHFGKGTAQRTCAAAVRMIRQPMNSVIQNWEQQKQKRNVGREEDMIVRKMENTLLTSRSQIFLCIRQILLLRRKLEEY